MNKLIISYDLRKPGRNYDSLYSAIKAYGTYASPTESMWLISTNQGANDVRVNLQKHIDPNDKLIVMTYGGYWAGTQSLGQAILDWLKDVF
jgi:hypothetical protein